MSVAIEVYPELIHAKKGLRFVVHNPTNANQDITVKFQDDVGVFATLVTEGVKPGEYRAVVLTDDDLHLSDRAGKTVVAYPTIPTPGSGVYLLGTSLAPGTAGNAVVIKSSSTIRVTVLDEAGNAIPYATVNLLNLDNGKVYTYTAGADGVCEIPDRPTSDYGRWALEVIKMDPARQMVAYALVPEFNFTNTQVTCKWARNFLVEVTLAFAKSDNAVINAVKNASKYLPSPLKAVCDWVVSGYTWASDQVFNFVMPMFVNEIRNKLGGNVSYVRQEGDTLKVGLSVGYGSPIAWAAILPWIAGIIIAICTTISVYFVSVAIQAWSPSASYEAQSKLAQQQQNILNQIDQAYKKGAIDKTTYDEAVKNVTEAYKNYSNNVPKYGIDLSGLIPVVVIVLVMILIISLIKAFKK